VPLGATFGVFLGSAAGAIVSTFLVPIGILPDRVGRKPVARVTGALFVLALPLF